MSVSVQLLRQLAVVIDLAIYHHYRRRPRTEERLMATSHIDDREAPMSKSNTWSGEHTFVIGTTVRDASQHARSRRRIRCVVRI
jgi:hypothetical protein